jgi:hypothetical protein
MDPLTPRFRQRASGAPLSSPFLRALPVGLAMLTVGCFEQPVSERIDLRFLVRGGVVISVVVRISLPEDSRNSLLRERVEATRRDLLEGRDAWSVRFEGLAPLRKERLAWEKSKGELDRSVHSALAEDEDAVRRFFSGSLIDASYTRGEHGGELVMIPGTGSRATSQQRQRLETKLDGWCSALADYYAATQALYRYLESKPQRAQACFGRLFEDLLSEEARARLGKTEPNEGSLIEDARRGMEQVLDVFSVPDDSAYSLEEISQLAYDPFPAPLVLHVPGSIGETEGFVATGKGELAMPGLSLWKSLRLLEERWHSPDPAMAYYEQTEHGGEKPFDLDGFVSRKRSALPPPTPADVRRALKERLSPAPIYRVKWTTEGVDPAADDALGWAIRSRVTEVERNPPCRFGRL